MPQSQVVLMLELEDMTRDSILNVFLVLLSNFYEVFVFVSFLLLIVLYLEIVLQHS